MRYGWSLAVQPNCLKHVKRPGSVWNYLWGNALKRSPVIIRKSRVSYPGPRFISSATWPSLPKKHYNGLNQTEAHARDMTSNPITLYIHMADQLCLTSIPNTQRMTQLPLIKFRFDETKEYPQYTAWGPFHKGSYVYVYVQDLRQV